MSSQTLTFTSDELFLIQEMMREARARPFNSGDYQDKETEELIDKIVDALDNSYDLNDALSKGKVEMNTEIKNIIKELTNLPTTIHDGFYQLRITHDLRNKVITLLKEQETELCERCGRRRLKSKWEGL